MTGSRKRARSVEDALREGRANALVQETLLGEAASEMLAALFVFGEDAEMIAVNEAACELTGWTREELLANPSDVLAVDRVRAEQFRRELPATGLVVGSGHVRTKDERLVPVGYVASMTRAAGTPFIVVVAAAAARAAPRRPRDAATAST